MKRLSNSSGDMSKIGKYFCLDMEEVRLSRGTLRATSAKGP